MRLITLPRLIVEKIEVYFEFEDELAKVELAGRSRWDNITIDFNDYKDKCDFLMQLYSTENQYKKLDTFIIDNYKFHGLFPVLLTDGLKNCILAFDHCEKLI